MIDYMSKMSDDVLPYLALCCGMSSTNLLFEICSCAKEINFPKRELTVTLAS